VEGYSTADGCVKQKNIQTTKSALIVKSNMWFKQMIKHRSSPQSFDDPTRPIRVGAADPYAEAIMKIVTTGRSHPQRFGVF